MAQILNKQLFVLPLSRDNIISPAESTKIFSNIESILQVSKVLCDDLEAAAEKSGLNLLSGIANCFKSLVINCINAILSCRLII